MSETPLSQTNMFEETTPHTVDADDGAAQQQNAQPNDEPRWPKQELLPHNRPPAKRRGSREKAGDIITPDIERGRDVLIITGYTSLTYLIKLLSACVQRGDLKDRIRIVIGKGPNEGKPNVPIGQSAVEEEMRSALLRERFSIYQVFDVIQTKKMLALDHVHVRTSASPSRFVHSKIYKTEDIVTLGSSNYSENGLEKNIEANLRLLRGEKTYAPLSSNVVGYAEQIWQDCKDYKEGLRKLLDTMLQQVSWKDALARGCAELLEGAWAKRYIDNATLTSSEKLWPFQTQGIAEALYLLEEFGSVLVADTTGSGKTRTGTGLMRSLLLRLWQDPAQLRNMTPVVFSPSSVRDMWERRIDANGVGKQVFSHAALSRPNTKAGRQAAQALRRAQVLVIDEAHNFLNRKSQRSQTLLRHMADHVILLTATPFNREPADLFRIFSLLGPDNFDDETTTIIEDLLSRRRKKANRRFTAEERATIKQTLRSFTLRRTKAMINQIIAADRENHINEEGQVCGFPELQRLAYDCEESDEDRRLARDITETAKGLKGLRWLQQPLHKPKHSDQTDERYLDQRLKGAKGLAMHIVMECMRSSRAALLEHIYGTKRALEMSELKNSPKAKPTGDVITLVQEITGNVPKWHLEEVVPPAWLTDEEAHRVACQEEAALYERIGELAQQLSTRREQAKARVLEKLLPEHPKLLGFDRHLITLHHIGTLVPTANQREIIVATGESKSGVRRLRELLDLEQDQAQQIKEKEPAEIIGLCSDSLSESVNLQKASAVVHLDMPTVIVRAVQRIGRIHRY